jgi:hypothetical protein
LIIYRKRCDGIRLIRIYHVLDYDIAIIISSLYAAAAAADAAANINYIFLSLTIL